MLVSARFNFSKNPAQSCSQTIHPHSLIGFLILHHPQVMSNHLVLSSSRILSSPRCFLLVLFCPLNPTLLLGYKFSPFLVTLGVEPDLSPHFQNPIVVAPLNKACPNIFNKCHVYYFYGVHENSGRRIEA